MTKFALASDLHLDILSSDDHVPNFQKELLERGVDVLLLAGDIIECKWLNPCLFVEPHKNTNRAIKFFQHLKESNVQVVWVFGNHEHYGSEINSSHNMAYDFLVHHGFDNVSILENGAIEFDDCKVIGSTLWTDFNKENPLVMTQAHGGMNDYRTILLQDSSVPFGRYLQPTDALGIHKNSLDYIEKELTSTDRPVVVLTHHHPLLPSSYSGALDYCYGSDLTNLILDNPKIKYWACGHTHEQFETMVGDTVYVTNAMGYGPEYESGLFNSFSLKIFEIGTKNDL